MTSSDTHDGSNQRRRSQLFLQMRLFAQLVLAHAMHVRRSCVRFVLERVAPRRVYSPYLFPIPWQGPGVSPTWALFFFQSPVLSVTCRSSSGPRGPALGWTGAQRALRGLAPSSVAIGSGAIGSDGGFIGKGTRRAGALRVRERQGSAPIADRRVLAIPGRSLRHRPNAYGKLPYVGLVSPNPCVQETNFLCTVRRGASNWLPKRERMEARNLSGGAVRP